MQGRVRIAEAFYAANIPDDCAHTTMEMHINNLGLCWGLVRALEDNRKMDCSGCDETKAANQERLIRFEQRKKDKSK